MGWLCDQVVKAGCFAIADFICPTPAARDAFFGGGDAFVIWIDRIQAGAFEDTNRLFVPPERFDLRVTKNGAPEYWAEQAMERLRPVYDWQRPTALFIGRYQPFHDGHRALIVEGLRRVGQVCIAVRDTHGIDDKNPYDFEYVKARIEHRFARVRGALYRRAAAEHHPCVLRARRRLCRRAHRPRSVGAGHFGDRIAQEAFGRHLEHDKFD